MEDVNVMMQYFENIFAIVARDVLMIINWVRISKL